jgi:2-hydroxy-3-keto-5-methylthiopentenyl-1-phosphate phosphatase
MNRIVFCDFDGTITIEETFVALLRQFTPDLADRLMPEMYAQRLTLRQGVRQLLESIPSAKYPELIEFAKPQAIRPGFAEFLDFLDREQVPFVLISGGVTVVVETVLGQLIHRMTGVHAVELDTTGPYLKPISEFEGGTELVAKVDVIAQYSCDEAIVIGDSITDLNMALKAPVVFARDRLAIYLQAAETPYHPWEDFHAIRQTLAQQWHVTP